MLPSHLIRYKHFYAFLLISCFVNAQDTIPTDTITRLPEVQLTYQAGSKTPVTFLNINAATIDRKSVGQEPSFLLSETPSITVYSDGGNTQGYSYFRMRGIDQTRINMTLDGVPLNDPEDQGAYFSNYPDIFNSVSNVQVQRGVGTSKNGTAGYGGSVQLFAPNLSDKQSASVGAGYGSFNSARAFAEYNSGIKNNKALYARVSQIYSDGYKYHSSNKSQSAFLSGGLFRKRSDWKINLLAGQQRNQLAWLGVADSLIAKDRRTNVNNNEDDHFLQAMSQVLNTWRISNASTLQSSVYYTFLKGNYDFDPNNYGYPPSTELYNYAFLSNLTGVFSNYTFTKNNLSCTTGIHANTYSRRHTGSERTLGELYENTGRKHEESIFTKASYSINRFTLFADLQYRHVEFSYDGAVPFDAMKWDFFNPKAGLSYQPSAGTTLYYSVGRTKREPTRNDIFGGSDDLLADDNGNALLFIKKAEQVTDHELGIRYNKGNWRIDANAYYMDFENEIVLDGKFGPNGLALTNNVKQSIRAGVELSASYKMGSFTFINNSSWNHSRIKEQDESFSPILSPKFIINQEAAYTFEKLSLSLTGRYQDKSYIDFANSAQIDGYFLLNARAGYTFGKLEAAVFANNITNTKYFNNGYVETDGTKKYFVQAPVNVYASLVYHL
ncbi:TonB-dependent receptor [Flavobacterium album]|uniref:TonB-dependent receptor n=1 Tax=Flavobacterium album TaxID=2175091 RepID=A0A2S1QX28_9FLAO|nr:TonB-dependent receptor [Flavobacterium album]AWH84958.1 TonB-dependent receptor [Flavobacterium album]